MKLELNGSGGYEIKTDYTYNNFNRLTDLIQQKTGAVELASYNYQLKAEGMRHSLDENFPANENRSITYTYDNLNRLIQEDADSSGDGYTTIYEYDLVGNRTQREVNVNSQTLITDYTYDPNTDRLIKETHTGPVYSFDAGNRQYYAYAAGGKSFYYRDLHGNNIGPVRAFFMGLPSVWSRYLFVLLMVLLPVMLFSPAVVGVVRRLVSCYGRPTRLRLRVPRKGICLFVAFVMLFGSEEFHSLAQADVQYSDLSTATWAQGNRDIHYAYDDNGSVIEKITAIKDEPDPQNNFEEKVTQTYNLQNRLAKVTTEDEDGDLHIAEYTYNDEGIRVKSYSYDIPYGQGVQNEKTVVYLIDEYNHTGYAQTLEEKAYNGTDTSGAPDSLTTYLIGDDIIAQTVDGDTQYLLYDGHGSTRQLAEYDSSVTIADSYSYDGYGVLLQDDVIASANPGKVSPQQTNLLYAGEHFDTDAQQYYLRARWYNPSNGLFNRVDPYSGNTQDPQSLHKYLYCHANSINATDPGGDMTCTQEASATTSIGVEIFALSLAANVLVARTAVRGLTSPSVIAHLLRVPIIPLPEVKPKTSDPGYVYFVHGTHTLDWLFRYEVRGDIGGQQRDFGQGFYTFKLSDLDSLKTASQFAVMVSASRGHGFSSPILIIVRFHRTIYDSLIKKDLKSNPAEWGRWVNDFWKGKRFAPTGYDEIYGPVSNRTKGTFVPNWKIPIQHKFEQSGISKGMEVVGVVPIPNRFQVAGR